MKRILTLIAAIAVTFGLVSCEKSPTPKSETTYTIKMAISSVTPTSVVKIDLTAFEYNDAGEKIASNTLYATTVGESKTFSANERSVKIKVQMKMHSDNTTVPPIYRWIQQVFYLEEGKNVVAEIGDSSRIGTSEP